MKNQYRRIIFFISFLTLAGLIVLGQRRFIQRNHSVQKENFMTPIPMRPQGPLFDQVQRKKYPINPEAGWQTVHFGHLQLGIPHEWWAQENLYDHLYITDEETNNSRKRFFDFTLSRNRVRMSGISSDISIREQIQSGFYTLLKKKLLVVNGLRVQTYKLLIDPPPDYNFSNDGYARNTVVKYAILVAKNEEYVLYGDLHGKSGSLDDREQVFDKIVDSLTFLNEESPDLVVRLDFGSCQGSQSISSDRGVTTISFRGLTREKVKRDGVARNWGENCLLALEYRPFPSENTKKQIYTCGVPSSWEGRFFKTDQAVSFTGLSTSCQENSRVGDIKDLQDQDYEWFFNK